MKTDKPERQGVDWTSRYGMFGEFIGKRVTQLQARFFDCDPRARADLARLRRAVGRPIASDIDSWALVFERFPEALLGRSDAPTRWETAAHITLGLFAVHIQSASGPMHVKGWGMGRAIHKLANPTDAEAREKPVMRRFRMLATATDLNEAVHHGRGMVQQFRAAEIPLDYVRLSRDLVDLQSPRSAETVRLRWARDLYRKHETNDRPASEETQEQA